MQCRKCNVQGRVQGVFFRASTADVARRLGVTGHALNLPDGSVEVLACGDPASVDALCAWLKQGPQMARVDSLRCEMATIAAPDGFSIG